MCLESEWTVAIGVRLMPMLWVSAIVACGGETGDPFGALDTTISGNASDQSPSVPVATATPEDPTMPAAPMTGPIANPKPAGDMPSIGTPVGLDDPDRDDGPVLGGPDSIDQNDPFLGLPAPARGFRIATVGREIPVDSDVEYCEVAELPGSPEDEILVRTFEVANGLGSHHLIVSVAEPGSVAEQKLSSYAIGEQVPCIGADIEFGREGIRTIMGAQTPYAKSGYPDGIGVRLSGGQRVVFDYHYFNFSDVPLMAKSVLSVHTFEPDAEVTLASSFSITNMTIDTPPASAGSFTGVCTLKQDALVNAIGRHTHAHGTDFSVWFEGGARHGEAIWTSHDWEHDTGFSFDEPVLVRAGEGFRFACGFQNESARPLRFGIASTDEMCILIGTMWSPTAGVELETDTCVLTWVDADGVARNAYDRGGFPAASADDALACHTGFLGLGYLEACLGCMCDRCGTVMAACNADPDCKPLLDCNTACQANDPEADCTLVCEEEMFTYSSGVGMVTQVGACIASQCADPCNTHDPLAR